MLLHHGRHIAGNVRVIDELVGREATAARHIRSTVAHLADGSEVDGLRRGVLELVVVTEHQGAGAGEEGFAELDTGQCDDLVLAECVRIVDLAAGRPITAVLVGSGTDAAGGRGQMGYIAHIVHDSIGVVHTLGGVALLVGEPVDGAVVGLIDQLGVGGQAFGNLEKQVAVVAHILTLGVDHIVVHLVQDVDADFLEVTAFSVVAVLVAVVPGVEQLRRTVAIV